ncbi:MAG: hypothetical protein WCT33_00700 [Patescibacteria group bacterium]
MEDQKNKSNPSISVNVASGKKDNEEKEILKGAKILIKDQKGQFSYVNGAKLLGEENTVVAPVNVARVPKPTAINPSVIQKAVAQLSVKKTPNTPVPTAPVIQTVPKQEPVSKEMVTPASEKQEGVQQITASQLKPGLASRMIPGKGVNASFYFDVEDEEEVKRLHNKEISSVTRAIDYGAVVKEIAGQVGVSFSDELMQKRFESLITSRLRDIRTSVQLRELLVRSKKVGGLELAPEVVEQIVKITAEKAMSFHDEGEIKKIEMRQRMKMQEAEKEKEQQERMRKAVANEQIKKAVLNLHQQNKNELENEIKTKASQPAIPVTPVVERRIPILPKIQRPMPEFDSRPKIVDIKTPPRLMGPIEEIRSLNLVDFRRLGGNPRQAIEKIKEKVDLLEEESFTKKSEAIQAWKKSEIYQIYLDIGNEGMNKGKSVQEVITSRKIDGRSYLTDEEFEAVGDLNKQLRF